MVVDNIFGVVAVVFAALLQVVAVCVVIAYVVASSDVDIAVFCC